MCYEERNGDIILKNKDIRKAKIKKTRGKPLIMDLSEDEKKYAEEKGATVEVYLYKITVSFPLYFRVTESTPNIVKNLFLWSRRDKKHVFYKKLSKNQKKACESERYRGFITVKPHKYKVISN